MSDSEYNLIDQMPSTECYLPNSTYNFANSIHTQSDSYFNSEWHFRTQVPISLVIVYLYSDILYVQILYTNYKY